MNIKVSVRVFCVGIILYLLASFVAADFDIRNWDSVFRGFIAVFYLIGISFIVTIEKLTNP